MGLAASTILLTGGNAHVPGFKERFEREIRPFIPDVFDVQVVLPSQPQTFAWQGAARFARDCQRDGALRSSSFATKAEYLECGHSYVNEKFAKSW